MTRPSLNAVAIVPPTLDNSIASTGFDVLRPTECLSEWLFLFVRSVEFINRMTSLVQGALYPAVKRTDVRSTTLPLPPLDEQRRIVAKIDALQARSRRAREALEAIPALLDRFRQSVLAAAFRGDLTAEWRAAHPDVEPASVLLERIRAERRARWIDAEAEKARARAEAKAKKAGKPWTAKDDAALLKLERTKAAKKYEEPAPVDPAKEGLPELPEGWCWVAHEDVVDVQLGQRKAPEFAGMDEYPYVRAANITWKGLDLSDVKSMGFADPQSLTLQPGDVLLNEASGSPTEVGKPAIWAGEIECCCFQATVLRLRPESSLISSHWIYFNRLRDALLAEYMARTPGIGIIHLTAKLMREWRTPVAPLDEQQELVDRLRSALASTYSVESATEEALARTESFAQSLLAKAFRGELVPQDPSDEPASELLKRIQAERAAPTTAGAKRKRASEHKPKKTTAKRASKKST